MIKLKTKEEIAILKEGGKRLAFVLEEVRKMVAPGVKTMELENLARKLIAEGGDEPAFLGYKPHGAPIPYPAALCVSINNEIVHGLPGERVLKDGDIVGLDAGLVHDGLYTDMAMTVAVSKISDENKRLIWATEEALVLAIDLARPGLRVGDLSSAIEQSIKKAGFNVVRDLAGHGVGYAPHEDPFVPNYGKAGTGPELVPGLVIAIEPMATTGSGRIDVADDGWSLVTSDGHMASHAEKTIVITEDGAEIITEL